MPLSDIQVRNLKPRDKTYKVSDFEDLFVLMKANGSKLWQFKYRVYGKERLLSIGIYPDVSLAQARKAKEEARARLGPFRTVMGEGSGPIAAPCTFRREGRTADIRSGVLQSRLCGQNSRSR